MNLQPNASFAHGFHFHFTEKGFIVNKTPEIPYASIWRIFRIKNKRSFVMLFQKGILGNLVVWIIPSRILGTEKTSTSNEKNKYKNDSIHLYNLQILNQLKWTNQ